MDKLQLKSAVTAVLPEGWRADILVGRAGAFGSSWDKPTVTVSHPRGGSKKVSSVDEVAAAMEALEADYQKALNDAKAPSAPVKATVVQLDQRRSRPAARAVSARRRGDYRDESGARCTHPERDNSGICYACGHHSRGYDVGSYLL